MALVVAIWLPANMLFAYLEYEVFKLNDPIEYTETDIPAAEEFLTEMRNLGTFFKLAQVFQLVFGTLCFAAILGVLAPASRGEPVSFGNALAFGFQRWGVVILASFLLNIALTLSLLALILPFFFFAVRLCLVTTVAALEGWRAKPFHRSFALTKDDFGRFFLVYALFFTVYLILSTVITVLIFFPIYYIAEDSNWAADAFIYTFLEALFTFASVLTFAIYQEALGREAARPPEIPAT